MSYTGRDYGSSDYDIVPNNDNWFPDLLDSNKNPLFYKAIVPPKPKKIASQADNEGKTKLQNLTVSQLSARIAKDLLDIITEFLTFSVNRGTFTSGTRSFSLGLLIVLISITLFIFVVPSETKAKVAKPIKIYFSSG